MKIKSLNKTRSTNFFTYALVIIAFIVMQVLAGQGMLTKSLQGYLIPICVYIVLAVVCLSL